MEQLTTTLPDQPASTRRMWRNYICGWAVYILLVVILQSGEIKRGFTLNTIGYLSWILILGQAPCLALLWPLGGWMERRRPPLALKVLIHAVTASSFAFVFFAVPTIVYKRNQTLVDFVWPILYSLLGYTAITIMFQMVRVNDARRRQELALQQTHALLVVSELNALRSKLNPHFLFNTLHSIIALTRKDPDAAETALFQFSDMLRYVLDTEKTGNDRVTLDEELRFVRDYLELESLRLGARLQVDWALDLDAGGHALPALSLQPLVENSIKHAFNPHSRPGRLTIRSHVDAATRALTLTVSDDGPGADLDAVRISTGLGIRTVDRRLQLEYGAGHGLAIETTPGAGFAVTMSIPPTGT